MTEQNIEKYNITYGRIVSLYNEIQKLSAKKPNDQLNTFKIRVVNQALKDALTLFGNEYLPINDFSQFDEDELPTNSDVVMVLQLYRDSLHRFRDANSHWESKGWDLDPAQSQEWNQD